MKLNLIIVGCFIQSMLCHRKHHFEGSFFALPKQIIHGGKAAPEGMAPYQISIQHNRTHMCGGAIISPKYILSAAHCMQP